MADIKLIETGEGGDFEMNGQDLRIVEGFQNMPYLGTFGGNVASNTREFNPGEQRPDWWGNKIIGEANSSIQFNSDLERLLYNTALTTSSRVKIEQTVKKDLSFMLDFSEIEVVVSIVTVDQILINIKISEPGNLESTIFVYLWDSTKSELINKSV